MDKAVKRQDSAKFFSFTNVVKSNDDFEAKNKQFTLEDDKVV